MKVKLEISKRGAAIYAHVHEIVDAESFGRAFAEVWSQVHQQRLEKATSIGALMEALNEDVVEELNGSKISLKKL